MAPGLGCVLQDGRSVGTIIQSMNAGGKHDSVIPKSTQIWKQTRRHSWMERPALPSYLLPSEMEICTNDVSHPFLTEGRT